MLSSLSSFLPTAFQGNQESKVVQPSPATTEDQQEQINTQKQSDNMGIVKKKGKKDKSANETFIFVRPPPAKSNHPLNLQVQLVPPSSRGDRSSGNRQSFDGSSAPPPEQQEQGGADLSRSDSVRSTDGSVYSAFTSNTSISSYSSAGSTSGRRMIIPLYNLQAHNVMTNTIVDAGTDAKIARFQKRGLEVIGLAILEPVEVWGEAPIIAAASARTSIDGSAYSHKEMDFNVLPPTPGLPSIRPDMPVSVSSSADHSQQPSNSTSPVTHPSLLSPNMPPSGAKKMFGKIFKRNQARPPSIILASDDISSPRSSTVISSSRPSVSTSKTTPPPSATLPSALSTASPETPTTATGLRPPVLGLQPMMSSPTQPPHGRPSKYVWVVRKWLKGSEGSILGGMMGKLSVNGKDALGLGAMGFSMAGGMGQVEVRFEWTRGVTKRKREKHSKDDKGASLSAATGQGANGNQSQRTSVIASESSKEHLATPSKKDKRLSGLSQRSASTHTGTSDEQEHQEEDGDESDPEDSDTPWTCVVSVQRVAPSSARQSSMSRPSTATSPSAYQQQLDQGVRLKVATLSPTPHHPKVVSMLKVPFPLPDIEVDKMAVRRRALTPSGIARPGTSTGHEGLILTAEEIKDVVSCTGLWLVVREGFGGVGRVSRKGDGWRIRG